MVITLWHLLQSIVGCGGSEFFFAHGVIVVDYHGVDSFCLSGTYRRGMTPFRLKNCGITMLGGSAERQWKGPLLCFESPTQLFPISRKQKLSALCNSPNVKKMLKFYGSKDPFLAFKKACTSSVRTQRHLFSSEQADNISVYWKAVFTLWSTKNEIVLNYIWDRKRLVLGSHSTTSPTLWTPFEKTW